MREGWDGENEWDKTMFERVRACVRASADACPSVYASVRGRERAVAVSAGANTHRCV